MTGKKLIDPGPSTRGWHHLQNVLTCPELYRLRQTSVTWESEPDKPAFVKGELVHAGLAHWYKRKQLAEAGKDPDLYYTPHEAIALMALKKAERSDLWHEWAPMAQQCLVAYEQEWAPDEQWEVLHVEKELKVQVKDPERGASYLYTQRADLIVRDRSTSKIWIVDHKTTFKISPRTVSRYTLNGQFIGYRQLGTWFFGKEFGGVKLNMVQLTDGFRFTRPRVPPAPESDDRLKPTIIHGERMIAEFEATRGYDQPWPQSWNCWGPYGACPAHDACQWGES